MNKILLILFVFFFLGSKLTGQELLRNKHLWTTAIGDVTFGNKWGFNSEVHIRFTNQCKDLQQYLFIPGISYKLIKEVQLAAGYTYFKNYPHGKYPLALPISENTLWEQITLKQKIGKTLLFHRFRMEERFTQRLKFGSNSIPFIQGRVYNNRFRYRILINHPIAFKERLYFLVFEEIWMNLSKNLFPTSMNQNLLYIGSFYKFNDGLKLGVGYMNQILSRNADLLENNSMISLLCLYKIKVKAQLKKNVSN